MYRIDPLRGIPFRPGFSYTDALNLKDRVNYHVPFNIIATGSYYLNGELISVGAYPMRDSGYWVAEYYDGIGAYHRVEFCFVPVDIAVAARVLEQYKPQRNLARSSMGYTQGELGGSNRVLLFSKMPCFVRLYNGGQLDASVLVADEEIRAPATVYATTVAKVESESDGSVLFEKQLTLQ